MGDGQRSVARMIAAVLEDEGVTHVFGNPGSTELPLLDAVARAPGLSYVPALQEAVAVAMADGYAHAAGRVGVAHLHTASGLGHAMGAMIGAARMRTPLVVIAGQQDSRHLIRAPWLADDLVGIARPVVKHAHELTRPEDAGQVLRRAFALARAWPPGPVFLSLPVDLTLAGADSPPPRIPAPAPAAGDIDAAASMIAGAEADDLVLLVSDTLAGPQGMRAAIAFADATGCRVFATPVPRAHLFPTDHPGWRGVLPPDLAEIRSILGDARLAVLAGDGAIRPYHYRPGPALPQGMRVIQLARDPAAPGLDVAADLVVGGDPAAGLAALSAVVARPGVAAVIMRRRAEKAVADAGFTARLDRLRDRLPLHPMIAADAVLKAAPQGVTVVNEASALIEGLRRLWQGGIGDRHDFVASAGLGWGMPAAAGVALATGRPVLCMTGDGGAMYAPQALWTAARLRLPVIFVILNNRRYDILMRTATAMGLESAAAGHAVGMVLDDPAIAFDQLAASMGVAHLRADTVAAILDGLPGLLGAGRPAVLEITIGGADPY